MDKKWVKDEQQRDILKPEHLLKPLPISAELLSDLVLLYDRNSKSPALQWQSKPPDTKNPDTQYENGFFSAEYNPRKDFTIKYDNGDVSGSYSKNSKELVLSKLIDEYNKLSVSWLVPVVILFLASSSNISRTRAPTMPS